MASAVKTSGAKGVHVFVPLVRDRRLDDIAAATRAGRGAGRAAGPGAVPTAECHPRRTAAGRCSLDSTRSGGATVVAAYSPRSGRESRCVPGGWSDLDRVAPGDCHARTAPRPAASDGKDAGPWHDRCRRRSAYDPGLVRAGSVRSRSPASRRSHEGKRRARARATGQAGDRRRPLRVKRDGGWLTHNVPAKERLLGEISARGRHAEKIMNVGRGRGPSGHGDGGKSADGTPANRGTADAQRSSDGALTAGVISPIIATRHDPALRPAQRSGELRCARRRTNSALGAIAPYHSRTRRMRRPACGRARRCWSPSPLAHNVPGESGLWAMTSGVGSHAEKIMNVVRSGRGAGRRAGGRRRLPGQSGQPEVARVLAELRGALDARALQLVGELLELGAAGHQRGQLVAGDLVLACSSRALRPRLRSRKRSPTG